MARILRGEIRWADLNPARGNEQAGTRPVLILSHDVFNARSETVIAAALTSNQPRAGLSPVRIAENFLDRLKVLQAYDGIGFQITSFRPFVPAIQRENTLVRRPRALNSFVLSKAFRSESGVFPQMTGVKG